LTHTVDIGHFPCKKSTPLENFPIQSPEHSSKKFSQTFPVKKIISVKFSPNKPPEPFSHKKNSGIFSLLKIPVRKMPAGHGLLVDQIITVFTEGYIVCNCYSDGMDKNGGAAKK